MTNMCISPASVLARARIGMISQTRCSSARPNCGRRSTRIRPPFQVTMHGQSIWRIRTPRSGLHYSEGYARLEAARWAGYQNVEAFFELDLNTQARLIAHYETAMQIQAVLAQSAADRQR